jgi:hypothetical protein
MGILRFNLGVVALASIKGFILFEIIKNNQNFIS